MSLTGRKKKEMQSEQLQLSATAITGEKKTSDVKNQQDALCSLRTKKSGVKGARLPLWWASD